MFKNSLRKAIMRQRKTGKGKIVKQAALKRFRVAFMTSPRCVFYAA
jgi:hypothetical protein